MQGRCIFFYFHLDCTFNTKNTVNTTVLITDFILTRFRSFTEVAPQKSSSQKIFISIIVPFGVVLLIIMVFSSFVLYKRKKAYGSFYLFSYPPLPDYMESFDINGNVQEQIQKLPFIPEWEFPRERISFGKYK